jgi:hypothetical protein
MRRVLALLILVPGLAASSAQTTISFDALLPQPGDFLNDTSISVEAATFINHYNPEWGSWAGYALSTVSNTTDNSWLNQYAAIAPRSNAYAVAYENSGWDPPPEIRFDLPAAPKSVLLNNTTWTALAIRDGNSPARAFADGDHFLLTLTAYDLDGAAIAATNHFLADFRDGRSFIQTNWSQLDLSWLPPTVASLVGTLETTDVGAFGANTPTYFALADFAYAYGGFESGLAATNPAIRCWADGVASYTPGPNVSNQFAIATNALGPATPGSGALGATNTVVSLGDGGHITLTFPVPITDGPGPDFAVFENAFSNSSYSFLEFAYVEVSSDGSNFIRFPSHTLAADPVPTYPADPMEPEAYGGLAGKHLQGTGTPFDLRILAGAPGLDPRRVTHVRLVDIVGDGSALDSYGNPIYDPHPTHGSGGFDLDAIGVLNPLVDIALDPAAPAPALPGYTTVLEFKAGLHDAEWTPVESRALPGFYRWRLVK